MKATQSWARLATGSVVAAMSVTGLAVTAAPATASGAEGSYLVLAPQGQGTDKAVAALGRSGAEVVADYPQIGVVVARATGAEADEVRRAGVGAVAATAGLGTRLDEDEAVVDQTVVEQADAAGAAAAATPEDEPLWGSQWDMRAIGVEAAQQVTQGSKDVVVGVLDTGVAANHPDLVGQVDASRSAGCVGGVADPSYDAWQPTTIDHGTHVAGTIAAADNGVGIVGVAPGVTLASVKVTTDEGYIFPEAAVCGFMWAAEHGFDLTNNSYYIDPWQFNCRDDAEQRAVWQAVQRAIRYSQSKGVLNIASAGNYAVDLQHTLVDSSSPNNAELETREVTAACLDLPAEAPGVVTVSATGYTDVKSYYSSYGQGVVDVAAPGGDTRVRDYNRSTLTDAVLSSGLGRNGEPVWNWKQGTSMASPHAAGVAALALSAHPELTPGALATELERTAEPLACPEGEYDPIPFAPRYQGTCIGGAVNGFYGHGLVDAAAVVQ